MQKLTTAMVVMVAGLLASCQCDVVQAGDAGSSHDAGTVDAGPADGGPPDAGRPDAGRADAGRLDAGGPQPDAGEDDAGPAFVLPLPVIRLDLRNLRGQTYVKDIAGTVELPSAYAQTIDTVELWSWGMLGGPPTITSITNDGGVVTLAFTMTLDTLSDDPVSQNELVSAQLPNTEVRLLSTLDRDPGGLLSAHFSAASTALVALALSEVPVDDPIPLFVTSAPRPGDRPDLDARVPAVALAIDGALRTATSSGVDYGGFPRVGGTVFNAVELGPQSPGAPPAPSVDGAGLGRLGVVEGLAPGNVVWVSFWLDGNGVAPALRLPTGTSRIGFFAAEYFLGGVGSNIVARQAVDLVTGRASAPVPLLAPPAQGPPAPQLQAVTQANGVALRASGVQPGNWVLFMLGPVGFEAMLVPDGGTDVTLDAARVPQGGLFRAYQVRQDRIMSTPSDSVIF